jgi:hypothetical protein
MGTKAIIIEIVAIITVVATTMLAFITMIAIITMVATTMLAFISMIAIASSYHYHDRLLLR